MVLNKYEWDVAFVWKNGEHWVNTIMFENRGLAMEQQAYFPFQFKTIEQIRFNGLTIVAMYNYFNRLHGTLTQYRNFACYFYSN